MGKNAQRRREEKERTRQRGIGEPPEVRRGINPTLARQKRHDARANMRRVKAAMADRIKELKEDQDAKE